MRDYCVAKNSTLRPPYHALKPGVLRDPVSRVLTQRIFRVRKNRLLGMTMQDEPYSPRNCELTCYCGKPRRRIKSA